MTRPLYNHLPEQLKNRYIIQRHGFSLANNEKLICSNPDIAIPPTGGPLNTGYGLHDKGKEQVKESALRLSKHLFPSQQKLDDNPVVIFCSPFKRTVETAEIIQGVLNDTVLQGKLGAPIKSLELRERCQYDIESPSSVCDRATRFIVDEIESKMEGKTVILVAHGDICQIMLTAFKGTDAWRHREMEHVDTAHWRDTLDFLK
ncbi:unnamed protein product [Rhizopus microsporus]